MSNRASVIELWAVPLVRRINLARESRNPDQCLRLGHETGRR
jgi:hypothetical protein